MSNSSLALLGGRAVLKRPLAAVNYIGREERIAVQKVMKTCVLSDFIGRAGDKFLGGREVRKFEFAMRRMFKVKYAVSFNSASTALNAAVAALGIGPGDEVITTPYTMSATATAILQNNAVPIFADIDDVTFCLNPKSIEKSITKKTKAIIVVNLFGNSADYGTITPLAKKYGLKIIEDNAQSIGAKYHNRYLGTIGDVGVFSFNANKALQCGEGGVLVTNNKKIAFRAQLARNHGEAVIDDLDEAAQAEDILGNNFRLTELHAAIAIAQLKKMEKINGNKISLAKYITKRLSKYTWLIPPYLLPRSKHVYFSYPLRFLEARAGFSRSTFAQAMRAEGFPLNEGYVKPVYLMSIYKRRRIYQNSQFPFVSKEFKTNVKYQAGLCPVAERLFTRELLLSSICNNAKTKKNADLFIKAIAKIDKEAADLAGYKN